MPTLSLPDWIVEFSKPDHIWYLKRLSANDTLANGSHQAGPYFPKELLFRTIKGLDDKSVSNPRVQFDAFVDSGTEVRSVTAIWYNNKLRGGSRNEARVTGWGGGASALLDPDSTGALAVFVFRNGATDVGSNALHVWVCSGYEDEVFEDLVGPVDPGKAVIWHPGEQSSLIAVSSAQSSCVLSPADMPPDWLLKFPSAAEIVSHSVRMRPLQSQTPDDRLMRRRKCEFEIFQAVEETIEGPKIAKGFDSIGEFLTLAQTILQRRKSRSGRSLELHAKEIFLEEGLMEDETFSHGATSEGDKKPDFLFPSVGAYRDGNFPAHKLRMLAAKTTAKDRWRQVLNEANRIPEKHLLTLQEGVSVNQFAEMEEAKLRLVVPEGLIASYPESIRPKLLTVDKFIYEIRLLT